MVDQEAIKRIIGTAYRSGVYDGKSSMRQTGVNAGKEVDELWEMYQKQLQL